VLKIAGAFIFERRVFRHRDLRSRDQRSGIRRFQRPAIIEITERHNLGTLEYFMGPFQASGAVAFGAVGRLRPILGVPIPSAIPTAPRL
jgi:hypothetical protein